MKTKNGYTIKAIAHELGLPPVHRSWLKVSLVWRSEADRLGLDRPRLSPEAIKKRLSSRKEKS